jgi:hypothetical protein
MFTTPHPAIKTPCAVGLTLALFLLSSAGWSANILFYYSGSSIHKIGDCAQILTNAGNSVKVIDVGGA